MPNLYSLFCQKSHRNIIPEPTSQKKKFRIRIRSTFAHTLIQTMKNIPCWKFNERPEEEELEQWGVEENVLCDELLPGGVHAHSAGLLAAAGPHTGVHVPPRLQHNTPHQASASAPASG